jgi:hypothetical protein
VKISTKSTTIFCIPCFGLGWNNSHYSIPSPAQCNHHDHTTSASTGAWSGSGGATNCNGGGSIDDGSYCREKRKKKKKGLVRRGPETQNRDLNGQTSELIKRIQDFLRIDPLARLLSSLNDTDLLKVRKKPKP